MRADLHIHTNRSDGTLTPQTVAQIASRAGVELLSVTDHDTVKAYEEVKAECAKLNVKAVCGIEVSAYFGEVKVHTLGYNFNLNSPKIKGFLDELYQGSLARAEEIIFLLKKCGVEISLAEAAAERFSADTPLHAMHIARAAVKKGYAPAPFAFYEKFLARGRQAFVNLYRPTPERATQILTEAGGFVSLAHPARIELDKAEIKLLISRMKEYGLGGIEAVYSAHTKGETAYYKELAKEFGLNITGGSDTHNPTGGRKIGTPFFQPDKKLLQILET